MKNAVPILMLAGVGGLLLTVGEHADGQGRRPAPAVARPVPAARPAAPVARAPTLSPAVVNRPAPTPAARPAPVAPHLPSNFQRPAQLPQATQPKVALPKADIALPGKPSTLPAKPPTLPARPTPLPARPTPGLPGSIKGPEQRPTNPDVGKWLNLPRDPGGAPRPPGISVGGIAGSAGAKKVQGAIAVRPAGGNTINQVNINSVKNYQKQGVYVRNQVNQQFNRNQWFSQNWWQRSNIAYPSWHYHTRYPGRPWSYWWRPATWVGCTAWVLGSWAQPFYFDYGANVIYRDNYVYINDVQVDSAQDYADEALQLASMPPPADPQDIEWMPLGTFALASSKDAQGADLILQLAISKEGLISGTFFNQATDKTVAVEGRVDASTQRVAIHNPDNPDVVLETGLYNLTQDQTPVLVHFGTLRTQTWFLVRLDVPDKE